jgi:hypothetical protein
MSAPPCSASPGYEQPNPGCPSLVQQGECWPNIAPCGVTQYEQIVATDNLGVAFSENAWAAAQQEGQYPCPDRYPKWPAPKEYMELDQPQQLVTGMDPDMAIDETPYLQQRVFPVAYNDPAEFADPAAAPALPYMPMPPGSPSLRASPVNPPSMPPMQNPVQMVRFEADTTGEPSMDQHFFPLIGYGIRGIWYHLSNYSQVPQDSFFSKLHFIFLAENRWKAIVFALISAILLALLLYLLLSNNGPFARQPYQYSRPTAL